MESPLKKRKIPSQESQGSKITSTPQRVSNFREDSPDFSNIGNASSARSSRCSSQDAVDTDVAFDESFMEPYDEDFHDLGDDELDYDKFFSKIAKFRKNGRAWALFKPIGEEQNSLYRIILNEPQEAGAQAAWFVNYCRTNPKRNSVYFIYRFVLDCAGYQQTNIKKYFSIGLPSIEALAKTVMTVVDDKRSKAEVFTTGKFLFADNTTRLAKIFQSGIYNFVQKFVLEAHKHELLYDEEFIYLLQFLEAMFNAQYRQLMYTSVIFMIKLLTPICMVKSSNPDSTLGNKKIRLLDYFINKLFMHTVKACRSTDNKCMSLKVTCINEIQLWIHFSPKVFIDQLNCVPIVGKLLLDEAKTVRLAALEALQKIVQDDQKQLIAYLQAGPIQGLVNYVAGRFCDIDINVSLKAMEVYIAMIKHHFNIIDQRKNIFESLIKSIYHEDYRMGSAAGRCVIEILNQKNFGEKSLLVTICKLAVNYHPTLKPLLVESCMESTGVLQDWDLFVELMKTPHCDDIPVEIKETVSELFLESVHQVLTGASSRQRLNSKKDEVDLNQHQLIADKIYPSLRIMAVINKGQPLIIRNIFKIVTKIQPEYLSDDHIQPAEQFLQKFVKFFNYWNDTEISNALLDFLVYFNDRVPRLGVLSRDAVQDLKKYVSEELYKSFKSQDNNTMVFARKAAVAFSKFDLNEHIEWNKLLVSWDIIDNVEFLEDMMKCCHWGLIWKIRKLSAAPLSKAEQAKEVSSLTIMSKAYFSKCSELIGHEDQNIKFKAFERICEVYIAFCQELENISKQIRSLDDLKPSLKEKADQMQLTDVFELSVVRCKDSMVQKKYAMYIVNMAFCQIIPMDCISIVFKYYDKSYNIYGKLIESVMSEILEKKDDWIPMLLVNAICICFESYMARHGVLTIRSREAKDILSLSRKFAECKLIKHPKIAYKVLFYGINYAVDTSSYEFLIFVRRFIDEIQNKPDMRRELLEQLKKKIPQPYPSSDALLYFEAALAGRELNTNGKTKQNKTGRPSKTPKELPIRTTKVKNTHKGKENVMPREASQNTESSAASDDMTIHDTSSDDLDDNMSRLNVSQ